MVTGILAQGFGTWRAVLNVLVLAASGATSIGIPQSGPRPVQLEALTVPAGVPYPPHALSQLWGPTAFVSVGAVFRSR
jgi:hypothetical protein